VKPTLLEFHVFYNLFNHNSIEDQQMSSSYFFQHARSSKLTLMLRTHLHFIST